MTDFTLHNEGSIALLTPISEAGTEWVSQHIPEDAMRFAGAVVIEHRYVADIVAGITGDGLTIE